MSLILQKIPTRSKDIDAVNAVVISNEKTISQLLGEKFKLDSRHGAHTLMFKLSGTKINEWDKSNCVVFKFHDEFVTMVCEITTIAGSRYPKRVRWQLPYTTPINIAKYQNKRDQLIAEIEEYDRASIEKKMNEEKYKILGSEFIKAANELEFMISHGIVLKGVVTDNYFRIHLVNSRNEIFGHMDFSDKWGAPRLFINRKLDICGDIINCEIMLETEVKDLNFVKQLVSSLETLYFTKKAISPKA